MVLRSVSSLGVSLSQCLHIFLRLTWRRAEQQLTDGRGHRLVGAGLVGGGSTSSLSRRDLGCNTTLIPNLIPTCDGRGSDGA